MDLEIIILIEVSQRQVSYDVTYGWNPKNDISELIYRADTENKFMVCKVERGRGIN